MFVFSSFWFQFDSDFDELPIFVDNIFFIISWWLGSGETMVGARVINRQIFCLVNAACRKWMRFQFQRQHKMKTRRNSQMIANHCHWMFFFFVVSFFSLLFRVVTFRRRCTTLDFNCWKVKCNWFKSNHFYLFHSLAKFIFANAINLMQNVTDELFRTAVSEIVAATAASLAEQ